MRRFVAQHGEIDCALGGICDSGALGRSHLRTRSRFNFSRRVSLSSGVLKPKGGSGCPLLNRRRQSISAEAVERRS